MEIVDGIHRIDTPLGDRVNSLYLFTGPRGAVLLDSGVDGTIPGHVLPYLDTIGVSPKSVRAVVISHADVDHFGGVSDAHEHFAEALVCAHRWDAPLIAEYSTFESARARGFRDPWGLDEDPEVLTWTRSVTREAPLDMTLMGGERIDLGDREVEILHVPGHSRGHLAVHDPSRGAVAVSDAVLSDSVRLADGTPAFPPTYRFVDSYVATIDRLLAMDEPWLLTAHYPSLHAGDARDFLTSSAAFAERLESALMSMLADRGPSTLCELLDTLNPVVGAWPEQGTVNALAFPVVGHLERLMAHGLIRPAATSGTTFAVEVAR